jgi:hypothetical protein
MARHEEFGARKRWWTVNPGLTFLSAEEKILPLSRMAERAQGRQTDA